MESLHIPTEENRSNTEEALSEISEPQIEPVSLAENELRQRNVSTVVTKSTPTTTTTATTITDNYKNDLNHNGGGFYECNIW